jgi:hypothetical protein
MATRLLQLDDLRQVQTPDKIASLFHKLGYNAQSSELDVKDLELPARSTEAVWKSYLIANQGKNELQVLLFHLHSDEFSSPSVASSRMRSIANSLCRRPSNFLLLGTQDYNQLMLVNPRKSFDEQMNLKVGIRKLLIDRANPTNYDRDRLEAIAAYDQNPQELYQAQCEAFDVEKLTKQFFKGYKALFDRVQQVIKEHNHHSYFESQDRLHQFSQRLLGRIMFLYFLQKKEFLAGDRKFLTTQYQKLKLDVEDTDYYIDVLEPLFFETLNKDRPNGESPWGKIPYLNGGLFNRDYGSDILDAVGLDTPEKIEIPNSLFDPGESNSVLNFFNSYNFTVAENVEGDEDVAVDPEMLGKVFENMLEVEERGKSGTFYTPRGIVHFMCSEVLSRYLSDETGMDLETVKKIINFDPEQPANYFKELISPQQARRLKLALQTLKCLDPAVGSAAFPMGMMQVILNAYQSIAQREGNPIKRGSLAMSKLKRNIIAGNLYGVDIKPEAIEIAKLRMWLSLVVDIPDIDDVEPLPNLEYKLMCGDSLISTINGEVLIPDPVTNKDAIQLQLKVTPIQRAIQPLLELQQQYFDVQIDERAQLKKKILEAEANIFKVAIAERRGVLESDEQKLNRTISKKGKLTKNTENQKAAIAAQISELDQLLIDIENSKRSLSFFQYYLHFRDVFEVKGGFDIVIGNPPWGSDLSQKEKKILKEEYPEIDSSTPNSFAYFLGLAIKIARGRIAVVLPDSILIKDFTQTRKLMMPKLGIIQWFQNIGLPNDLKPFLDVEHDVCTLILEPNQTSTVLCEVNVYNSTKKIIETRQWAAKKNEIIRKDFNYAYNLMLSKIDIEILEKIDLHQSIENYMQCHEGIHTGNSREILFKQTRENDFCKPLFYGAKAGDFINNYVSKRNGWYVDYRQELIDKTQGYYASLRDERIFTLPKIYITRTGNPFKAFLDNGTYASNNFFSLQYLDYSKNNLESLKIILPFINSKISQYFIRTFASPRLGSTFIETKIFHLLKFKIPSLSDEQKNYIKTLVDCILEIRDREKVDYSTNLSENHQIEELKTKINNFLYSLYEFTDEEIRIIESA